LYYFLTCVLHVYIENSSVKDDWKWVDGTPLDYNNWNETQTNATYHSNDVIFNCSKIDQSSGKWINISCEELNGFVCKSKKRMKLNLSSQQKHKY
jgi:collectin sub-family protein 12